MNSKDKTGTKLAGVRWGLGVLFDVLPIERGLQNRFQQRSFSGER